MLFAHMFIYSIITPLPSGSLVALVTPMTANGRVDVPSLRKLVRWHIHEKTNGLVLLGTTGESSCLSHDEKTEMMKVVRSEIGCNIPLIVGTGSIDTKQTIESTKFASDLGADAAMIVTPYYVKPTQSGLYNHFVSVADSSNVPIILYNVPSRTGVDLSIDTTIALSRHPNIYGLKDATADLERVGLIRSICGKDFKLYSGDDATACDFVLNGGDGVISVTANVAPQKVSKMISYAQSGMQSKAKKIDEELVFLHKDLFCESNPIPVKWALSTMEKISSPYLRPPLSVLSSKYYTRIQSALATADCLNHVSSNSIFWVTQRIMVKGHLFDTALINQILELIEKRQGQFCIVNFASQSNDITSDTKRISTVTLDVTAIDQVSLRDIVERVKKLVGLYESAQGKVIEM